MDDRKVEYAHIDEVKGFIIEFDEHAHHRLVHIKTQEKTAWAGYQQITFLRDYIGCTAFYGDKEAVLTPHEFCLRIAVR